MQRAGHELLALKYYERAAKEQPSAEAWKRVGVLALRLKQYPRALSSLSKAQRLNPRDPSIANLLKKLHGQSQRSAIGADD